jgi:hypothetical protein
MRTAFNWLRTGVGKGYFERGNEPSNSIRAGDFRDHLTTISFSRRSMLHKDESGFIKRATSSNATEEGAHLNTQNDRHLVKTRVGLYNRGLTPTTGRRHKETSKQTNYYLVHTEHVVTKTIQTPTRAHV